MRSDKERIERVKASLREYNLDAVVCALPANVLLLSGYWPVIGVSLSLALRDGRVFVIAPEDEFNLAERGDEDVIYRFRPGSLEDILTPAEMLRRPLAQIARELNLKRANIGYEAGPWSQTFSYAAINLYGPGILSILKDTFPGARLKDADEMLHRLRGVKTPYEVDCIRKACSVAGKAFAQGVKSLRPELAEFEAANLFLPPLGMLDSQTRRAGGFVYCMSGSNSAMASGAYARSRAKVIDAGDLVLVHCNSYVDGYWTDITRTYHFDESEGLQTSFYEAVMMARQAALHSIRAGARAAEIDRLVRETMKLFGYTNQFKHSTGHGVGFAAIDAGARPRLHPKSHDILETGMVFNIEPAIYVDGYGGLRHCDVVAVTETGYEVLTPFQSRTEDLQLAFKRSLRASRSKQPDPMTLIGANSEADARRLTLPIRSTALMRTEPSPGVLMRKRQLSSETSSVGIDER